MWKVNKYQYIIITFLLGIIAVMFGGGGGVASAANNSGYSNVADDLQKDENFNVWDYPAVPIDYSLQVIQIAESTAGELFIYVYQPSGQVADLRATCVNMSLSEEVTRTDLYNLKYVNASGVFYKYIAEGVKVSSAAERFYNITSIYRVWNENYDKGTGNDNTIDEVVYEVGKLWRVTMENGQIIYDCKTTEIVTITDKYLGFIRYPNGFSLSNTCCDGHYVAFSTDYLIENLYEVEIEYITRPYTVHFNLKGEITSEEYGDYNDPIYDIVKYTDYGGNSGGLFKKYRWERIESAETFITKEKSNLSSTVEQKLNSKQWVLRFLETPCAVHPQINPSADCTQVTNMTILRLKFETAGKVYNLGVVDNKQSGSIIPSNGGLKWWQILLIVIACVLVLSLVLKLLSLVAPVFGVILSGLWWLITSPVRLIIWIVKKIRGEE